MLSADDVLLARFSTTKFRPGYDQGEVDEFLDRVVQTLREAGTREPVRRDVSVEELDGVTFRQTSWLEGYAIDEVDAFLAELRPSLASRPIPTPALDGPSLDRTPERAMDPGRPTGWRLVGQVLEMLTIGERPTEPRPLVRPPEAPRASAKNVVVTADEVRWRARRRVEGRLAVAEIRQIVLMDLEYSSRSSTVLIPYALVIDHAGAVRLRAVGSRSDRRLRQMWDGLGVPVVQASFLAGRVKDARRRWPEAFSFVHAYPVSTTFAVLAAYMLVVVPILIALGF
ncbi:DivIVA domain-containing protein [Cellulomonas soli]|uniref:Cell wall synthesis protein Wag31 n=1 Tax=Cellulomonas soli TaxID=931535 RepID=A0A512PCJ9_9CELL|nr:DivIVA domain-containing protein [Cellulomonas soli]NYI58509.1 DivIVA domain-containing protein [Cellulomonas soli]GEP68933.1 hypothetical protein CSO01_16480 [Cellulomonas soli]